MRTPVGIGAGFFNHVPDPRHQMTGSKCVAGAIKIRRFSSETHLKSDAEMTDQCGRHYAVDTQLKGRPYRTVPGQFTFDPRASHGRYSVRYR